jgi:hypothetical protein
LRGRQRTWHNSGTQAEISAREIAKEAEVVMSKTKQTLEVGREMQLTVEVMERGVVTLKLTGAAVDAELGPGDSHVIVLRPVQPADTPPNPSTEKTVQTNTETFNNSGLRAWDYYGGAGAGAEQAGGTDGPNSSEGWGAAEREDL